MDYLHRHIEFQHTLGKKTYKHGDVIFREYNQIIIPLGPVIQAKPIIFPDLNKVLDNLDGKLVWWSYANETVQENGWYAVIKREHNEIENYPSANTRNQIRKGLKNCEVRKVRPDWLAQNGLSVYRAAVLGYAQKLNINEAESYISKILKTESFQDIIEYWGIFYQEKLIGFAEIYLYGKNEANISQIKVDPAFQFAYPVYALIHKLSETYLKENQIACISDGYRNILHDTGVQEFFIQKFGFVKVRLWLQLKIKQPFCFLFWLLLPFQRFIIGLGKINAVLNMVEIYKRQNKNVG
jgi:hypothetical protein